MLLCYTYSTQGGTGGVSFANKNVSGLQKYLRFQNKYNKVEIELRVVQFCNHTFDFSPNCTPLSSVTLFISVGICPGYII